MIDRARVAARLLTGRVPRSDDDPPHGLVVVQIDGLGHDVVAERIAADELPNLGGLLRNEGYQLRSVYSGLPSTTPAAQAELFYGVPLAVPAFAFVDRTSGEVFRMSHRDAVTEIERRLSGNRPLLAGGASYANVYTGGAREARFCMASLVWTDPVRTRHPLALPVIAVLFSPDLLRSAGRVARELAASVGNVIRAIGRGEFVSEMKFAAARTAIGIVLRDLTIIGTTIDTATGVPIVHLNLLGYDEAAHHRGPRSPAAYRSLRDIDDAVGRLVRAARRSARRNYEVWVLSDHGQEATDPYADRFGRTVHEAIADVFRSRSFGVGPAHEPRHGVRHERARLLGDRVFRLVAATEHDEEAAMVDGVVMTAQGPVGHVYTPRRLDAGERTALAGELVHVGIPAVLAVDRPGTVTAWTERGRLTLPTDAGQLLGNDHPHLATVARELVELCHHPDAGDLVICGWQVAGKSLSFAHEYGAHAGPGPGETTAFVLTPADAPFAPDHDATMRHADVRNAALAYLDGVPRPRAHGSVRRRRDDTVRLMTYNVHSCVGLDGRLSPERVARVIAAHEPDIVALQELDVSRARTGLVDQAKAIAEQLEMSLQFHPTVTVAEEHYGDAVLSRFPMRLVRAGALPQLRRVPPLEPRGAIWVEVETPGGVLHVVNTHLSLHPLERRIEVEALLGADWLGAIAHGERCVLCGDFNALAWFPSCRRIGQRLRDVQVGHGERRPRATFSGRWPVGRIDHVFIDRAIAVEHFDVPRDGITSVASDHLPLLVDLRLSTDT